MLFWILHMPRLLLGHLVGHAALLAQWFAFALDGLATGLADLCRWICHTAADEASFYDDGSYDDGDDGGLA